MFTIEKNAYLDAYLDHNTLLNGLESAYKFPKKSLRWDYFPSQRLLWKFYTHFRDYSATYYGQDTRQDTRFFSIVNIKTIIFSTKNE